MRETDGQRDSEDREETRGRREESGTRGKSVSCAWPALFKGCTRRIAEVGRRPAASDDIT